MLGGTRFLLSKIRGARCAIPLSELVERRGCTRRAPRRRCLRPAARSAVAAASARRRAQHAARLRIDDDRVAAFQRALRVQHFQLGRQRRHPRRRTLVELAAMPSSAAAATRIVLAPAHRGPDASAASAAAPARMRARVATGARTACVSASQRRRFSALARRAAPTGSPAAAQPVEVRWARRSISAAAGARERRVR